MGVKSQIHRQTQKATVRIFLLIRVLFLLLRNIKKGRKERKIEGRRETEGCEIA